MVNDYGLDAEYFKLKLGLIVRDCRQYTPDEMVNDLLKLLMVAAHQANLSAEVKVKPLKQPPEAV